MKKCHFIVSRYFLNIYYFLFLIIVNKVIPNVTCLEFLRNFPFFEKTIASVLSYLIFISISWSVRMLFIGQTSSTQSTRAEYSTCVEALITTFCFWDFHTVFPKTHSRIPVVDFASTISKNQPASTYASKVVVKFESKLVLKIDISICELGMHICNEDLKQ